LADLDCFNKSCCRICHSHAMKFSVCFRFLFVSELAWTCWVNAQCVPRNDFRSELRWKQTCFLVTILTCCAVFTVLADTCSAHVGLSPIHVQRCAMVSSSLCSTGCINVKWHHSAHLCCEDLGTQILSFLAMSWCVPSEKTCGFLACSSGCVLNLFFSALSFF